GLPLPGGLPPGYHRLVVQLPGGRSAEGLVIAAPEKAYQHAGGSKTWGLFLPTYAIRTARDWGAGDLTDLAVLIGWVQARGGGLVGTLPLLATFLGDSGESSPF